MAEFNKKDSIEVKTENKNAVKVENINPTVRENKVENVSPVKVEPKKVEPKKTEVRMGKLSARIGANVIIIGKDGKGVTVPNTKYRNNKIGEMVIY